MNWRSTVPSWETKKSWASEDHSAIKCLHPWIGCVWKNRNWTKTTFNINSVLNNLSLGLTADVGSTRETHDGECHGNSASKRNKTTLSNKWKQPYSTDTCYHLESSSQFGIALPSAVPPKRFLQEFVIGPICLTGLLITSELDESCLLSTNYIRTW